MFRTLRQVLPPRWILITLFLVCLLFEAASWVLRDLTPERAAELGMTNLSLWRGLPWWVPMSAAVIFGIWRAMANHPAWSDPYKQWLKITPWSPRVPLPMGPVHLVWQDTLLIGVLAFLGHRSPDLRPAMPVLCFLIAYLGGMILNLIVAPSPVGAWSMTMIMGLVLLYVHHTYPALVLAGALYLVGYIFLRQSMQAFPWEKRQDAPRADNPFEFQVHLQTPKTTALGWPYNYLKPYNPALSLGLRPALMISILLGWSHYVGGRLAAQWGEPEVVRWPLVFALGLPFIRPVVYGGQSPISFWGRIFTGRWIIPSFDRIWIAPICSFAAGLLTFAFLRGLGLPDMLSMPATSAVTTFLALAMPPNLMHWKLTGGFRITEPKIRSANHIRL